MSARFDAVNIELRKAVKDALKEQTSRTAKPLLFSSTGNNSSGTRKQDRGCTSWFNFSWGDIQHRNDGTFRQRF